MLWFGNDRELQNERFEERIIILSEQTDTSRALNHTCHNFSEKSGTMDLIFWDLR